MKKFVFGFSLVIDSLRHKGGSFLVDILFVLLKQDIVLVRAATTGVIPCEITYWMWLKSRLE
jgi:hypothetical protein